MQEIKIYVSVYIATRTSHCLNTNCSQHVYGFVEVIDQTSAGVFRKFNEMSIRKEPYKREIYEHTIYDFYPFCADNRGD